MMLSCKVSFAMHNAFRANMGLDSLPFPSFLMLLCLHICTGSFPPLPKKTETDIGCVKAKLGQGEKNVTKKILRLLCTVVPYEC